MKRWLIMPVTMAAVVAGFTIRTPHTTDRLVSTRCTMAPGLTLAVLRVERDTVLPLGMVSASPLSSSGAAWGSVRDTSRAVAGTPMPAARVRLLAIDSGTRAMFAAHGVTDSQPMAFIQAAPYGADCSTRQWHDTAAFAVPGETGYVRATPAPRDQWVGNTPVLLILDTWNYPYPRRRALYEVPQGMPPAPPDAVFQLELRLDRPRLSVPPLPEVWEEAERARVARAMAWARNNAVVAEMEPVRTRLKRAVLDSDWSAAQRIPSRLRGTWRVEFESDGAVHTWYFRTQPQPAYRWNDSGLRSTAELLDTPYIAGYQLLGYAVMSLDSLIGDVSHRSRRLPLVWFSTNDRPTLVGNDDRRVLSGSFEFVLGAAPERIWEALESFVPPISLRDSLVMSQFGYKWPRNERQPRFPVTVRLDADGGIRADSTFMRGDRRLRITLTRLDTITALRTF